MILLLQLPLSVLSSMNKKPADTPDRTSTPVASMLMLGAGARSAGALLLVLGLWLAVAWALAGP